MPVVLEAEPVVADVLRETVADLVSRLGGIPLDRILLNPPPGRATEADAVRLKNCELIDGILVEMAMGWGESAWGSVLIGRIERQLAGNRIAVVAGADGLARLREGRVRIPDVGVYLLNRFPGGRATPRAVCDIAPDWAVEILSPSNTPREMQLKREQFFEAGTRRVWIVDPRGRTIEDWTSPDTMRVLRQQDVADLSDILPGFSLDVGGWFREMDSILDSETGARGEGPARTDV
ncbi:MAG: Uma2 family endonuclease [Planctomyces sp.]|nr:Uma2 family endonuclease [Planctomyces sp.]